MTSSTIASRIAEFLRGYPPFGMLSAEACVQLAGVTKAQFLRAGEALVAAGEAPAGHFYVVRQGHLDATVRQDDRDVLVDVLDEGDICGIDAVADNRGHRVTLTAADDSLIYLIPWTAFQPLIAADQKIEWFLKLRRSAGTHLQADVATMPLTGSSHLAGDDPVLRLFGERETIDLDRLRPLVHCAPASSILEAAQMMSAVKVGSILVTGATGQPLGIITDSDFRRRVVLRSVATDRPVSAIMSSPVVTMAPGTPITTATLMMMKNGISHICVTGDGTPGAAALGVYSGHDLLVMRGNNPSVLLREIVEAHSIDRVAMIRERAERLARRYLENRVSSLFLAGVMTELNDAMIRRILELCERRLRDEGLGDPPVRYAWLSLGSEGRGEQVLRTDQDNALAYEDPPADAEAAARDYFLRLGSEAVAMLERCGFDRCPGDVMASNPKWCQPIGVWKSHFRQWIAEPEERALMHVAIFFDFRVVFGDPGIGEELRSHVRAECDISRGFLPFFARQAVTKPPPLSFFRHLLVERHGAHKDEFDIKRRTLSPLVDAARVLALDLGLFTVLGTAARFREAGDRDRTIREACLDAAHGYEVLLGYRLLAGLRNGDSGRYIDPTALDKIDRETLRNTFSVISRIQDLLVLRYQLDYIRT